MMPALTVANVVTWAIQVTVIVALAAVLPRLVSLTSARARLGYFYVVLFACLLLPFVQPMTLGDSGEEPASVSDSVTRISPEEGVGTGPLQAEGGVGEPTQRRPVRIPVPPAGLIAAAAAAGVALRLAWLALGVRALGRLRRTAAPLSRESRGVASARRRVGVSADLRATPDVTAPVTFGARRPVILLPHDFDNLDEDQQVAIVCHELMHVKRHDWLTTVGEEILRSFTWFHPAISWLIDRVQLSREQVVDEEVVHLVGRDAYLDALLRLALPAPQTALRPVSLFVHRSYLAQRIAHLIKEGTMSLRRLVGALAAATALLAVAGALLVHALPLAGAPIVPPVPASAAPAGQADQSWPVVATHVNPVYPPDALSRGVGGRVMVVVSVLEDGSVANPRLDTTQLDDLDPLLTDAALAAAGQFRFGAPAPAMNDFRILFTFDAERKAARWYAPPRRPSGTVMPRRLQPPDPALEQRLIAQRNANPANERGYLELAAYYNRIGDFDRVVAVVEELKQRQPANAEIPYMLATFYWEEAYRGTTLPQEKRAAIVARGLHEVDSALTLQPDYLEALVYKNLLLRLQASFETDPGRRQTILQEADALRNRAEVLKLQSGKK